VVVCCIRSRLPDPVGGFYFLSRSS